MPKFRKKPVVIEAEIATEPVEISTLEGVMTANKGDYVITGVKGEKYPCKPDIFEATYEPEEGLTPLITNDGLRLEYCPNCKKLLRLEPDGDGFSRRINRFYPYCKWCGQHINWGVK